MKKTNQSNDAYIIMHSYQAFDSRVFKTEGEARNYLKFKWPKRNWKIEDDLFTCYLNGAKFRIIKLNYGNEN